MKALNPKQVEENPYMAKSDANIHHDGYNTDSTDEILPLAISPDCLLYTSTIRKTIPEVFHERCCFHRPAGRRAGRDRVSALPAGNGRRSQYGPAGLSEFRTDLACMMGREKTVERVKAAIEKLSLIHI